ncbi:unnamed protein product [Fusarium graminearum]|uniref:Chromosome 2, complete genome n=1 Tax=Gibberella zeae (strain ATCC MYA-4620 / CBS 123657 / FGSC 9075 / NRRL 31084 / PH-1) TaxID=229533 RepID=A0A098DJI2_GIBZE|nr:unnamed protein product [Fusarium graminearum]CEF78612.1 unnamed protein product [Fusarium graminearum]
MNGIKCCDILLLILLSYAHWNTGRDTMTKIGNLDAFFFTNYTYNNTRASYYFIYLILPISQGYIHQHVINIFKRNNAFYHLSHIRS